MNNEYKRISWMCEIYIATFCFIIIITFLHSTRNNHVYLQCVSVLYNIYELIIIVIAYNKNIIY